VVGETPNLAARLQGIAEPGAVVIDDGVRRLIGNLFDLQDLGEQNLKGIPTPVQSWAVIRASAVESRFDALRAGTLVGLVGRDRELDLLVQRWREAENGTGQTVLLSGEAGIGKSRLISALLERAAGEPHNRIRCFCSPQHVHSAFHPFVGQLERGAGLSREDTLAAKLDKLDLLLAASGSSQEDATLLAEMLSLPNDGRYPALALTPCPSTAEDTRSDRYPYRFADAECSAADDLRGCALERSEQSGGVGVGHTTPREPSRAAGHYVPA
jgi:hypothetical protein